jgi:uncharacterized protein (DUF2236 family)
MSDFPHQVSASTPAPEWPPVSHAIDYPTSEQMIAADPVLQGHPQAVTWRVNGEIIMVLGWGRAILLQIAHPKVAAGVGQHSHFATSPAAKAQRFLNTLNRMLTLTYGTPLAAWQAAQAIDTIHDRVNGLDESRFRYSARDPELLKWVHATFADSMFKTYEMFVGPLSRAEKDEYLHHASFVAPLLGAPYGYFPGNQAELDVYLTEMLESGTIKVGPPARQLADYVLERLPIPILGRVLQWYARLLVGGMLPNGLREAYGFKVGKGGERLLKITAWVYRRLFHPILPPLLRRWKVARQAVKTYKAAQN